MPTSPPINAPAGFVPQQAVAFADQAGLAVPVDAAHPLPTTPSMSAASSAPLTGSVSASGVVGPFSPVLGRTIWVSLTGTWTGSVVVQRSIDGGATRQPLTVAGQSWASFTANANEPIGDETVAGATYYLAITINSGALSYRIAQ